MSAPEQLENMRVNEVAKLNSINRVACAKNIVPVDVGHIEVANNAISMSGVSMQTSKQMFKKSILNKEQFGGR